MKKAALYLGCALALAGCSSEEDRLENAMRETLAAQGNVQEIEMTRQDENNMTGFAVVQRANESQGRRLGCTAARDPAKGAAFYNWRCQPVIDEAMLNEIEASIRQSLAAQGSVEEVEMTRRDDNNMTGFARVRDGSGADGRFDCTAARDANDAGNFTWRCNPPGAGAEAAAPADAGGK